MLNFVYLILSGGMDAEPNAVPWQVSIQAVAKSETTTLCGPTPKNVSLHVCGGSIINERTILTAAHCFLSS
jgi:secreted trypsin-like serine protease